MSVRACRVTILTVTAIGRRELWLIETARSVLLEKQLNGKVHWMLCVRGDGVLPAEVLLAVDEIVRAPLDTHVSYARNLLLSRVQTEFICTLDDDDVLLPGGLTARLELLSAHPKLGWVAGMMADLSPEGVIGDIWDQPAGPGQYNPGDLMKLWGSPNEWFVCLSHTFLLRTEAVRSAGGWRPISQEDILLVCLVTQRFSGWILPGAAIGYRRHDAQASRSYEELQRRVSASRAIFDIVEKSVSAVS